MIRFTKRFSSVSACAFFAARSAFKRGDVAQAAIDVLAVLVGALLIAATALGIVGSLFILLFVRA